MRRQWGLRHLFADDALVVMCKVVRLTRVLSRIRKRRAWVVEDFLDPLQSFSLVLSYVLDFTVRYSRDFELPTSLPVLLGQAGIGLLRRWY